MNSIQFNLARVIGPVIGGFALTALGAAWCFGLNGLSYIAVIASLLMIHTRFVPGPAKESVMESMKEGLRFIGAKKGMVNLIGAAFASTFLGVVIVTFLPVFARDVYKGNEATYTILLAVEAAGAITGALLVAWRAKKSGLRKDAILSLIALGGCVAGFALSPNMILGLVFLFFGGVFLISGFATLNSLVQHSVTDDMRGRVLSIYNIAFRGGMPLGSLAAGALIPRFGAPAVVAANGVLLTLVGLYLLTSRKSLASS
jgi:predicted MFS family arabinose efflux permease